MVGKGVDKTGAVGQRHRRFRRHDAVDVSGKEADVRRQEGRRQADRRQVERRQVEARRFADVHRRSGRLVHHPEQAGRSVVPSGRRRQGLLHLQRRGHGRGRPSQGRRPHGNGL